MRAWLALCGVAAASCASAPTQVLLVLEADPEVMGNAQSVRIEAYASNNAFAPPRDSAALTEQRDWPVDGPRSWPLRVLLRPQSSDAVRYRVVAGADVAGRRVETQVVSGYVRGETRELRLRLFASCVDAASCGPDERCEAGRCVDAVVDPSQLPCAEGSTCALDGGVDGATDAGPEDAGPEDAGADDGGPIDAGDADAGPAPPMHQLSLGTGEATVFAAEALEGGVVAVGSLDDAAFAVHYTTAGDVRWAHSFSRPRYALRLHALARRSSASGDGNPPMAAVGTAHDADSGAHHAFVATVGSEVDATMLPMTGEQVLYGVVDGGAVGSWIGVGGCGAVDGNRRGLVIGFGPLLGVQWARCVTVPGHHLVLRDVVVEGRDVFAVGELESVSGERHIAVVRLADVTMMMLGALTVWRSVASDSTGLAIERNGDRLDVLGTWDDAPAWVEFDPAGDAHEATVLGDRRGSLSGMVRDGADAFFVGAVTPEIDQSAAPFLTNLRRDTTSADFTSLRVPTAVRAPLVRLDGTMRLVASSRTSIFDVPFSASLAAGCSPTRSAETATPRSTAFTAMAGSTMVGLTLSSRVTISTDGLAVSTPSGCRP